MKSFAKIKDYIINEPWDAMLERKSKAIERYVIWPFIAFAIVYFGTLIVWRMP